MFEFRNKPSFCFQDIPETEYSYEYSNSNKTDTFLATERMSTFVNGFISQINDMVLRQCDQDRIFKLAGDLVNEMKAVNSTLIEDSNGLNPLQALNLTSTAITDAFDKVDSSYKRKKMCTSHPLYVAPREIATGTRFELETKDGNAPAYPVYVRICING